MKLISRHKQIASALSSTTVAVGTVITLGPAAAANTITLAQGISALASDPLAIKVGDTGIAFAIDDGTNWMDAYCTVTSSTQITVTQIDNGLNGPGAPVTFSGAMPVVYNTAFGSFLRRVPVDSFPTAFSTSVPLSQIGTVHMPRQTVAGNLTFTAAANAVRGAYAEYPMISDGVSTLTMANFTEHESSTGIPTAANIPFTLFFWNDGYTYWWSASKAASPVAIDNTPPTLSSPVGTQTGPNTATATVSTNEANGTLYYMASTNSTETAATVKAGGNQPVTATGTQSVSFSGLTAGTTYYSHFLHRDAAGNDSAVANGPGFTTASSGDTTPPTLSSPVGTQTGPNTATATVSTNEANGTLYYMASTNQTEAVATVKAGSSQAVTATGTQSVSFSGLTAGTTYYSHFVHRDAAGNDSAVANGPGFTTAAATVPGAPTIGTATAGDSSATVTWTPPASNGGAPVTGYTITATPGGATGTAAAGATSGSVPGLSNGTAYTFTVHATNSAGNSAESAATSPAVTPVAAPTNVRLNRVVQNCTESASAPWKYTGTGGSGTDGTVGAVSMVSKPSGVNGAAIFKVESVANSLMVQIGTSNTVNGYTNNDCIWANGGNWSVIPAGGSIATPLATVAAATGDYLKIEHTNADSAADFTVTTNWSVSKDNGNTWTLLYTKNSGRKLAYYAKVVPAGASVLSCISATGFA